MYKMTLEYVAEMPTITEDTCVEQYRAHTESYIDDMHEHCRVCHTPNQCPYDSFKPLKNTQLRWSHLRLWIQ